MLALLSQHRAAIESLCRQYHVKRLELFGSAARGQFDPSRSDIDLLIEFEDLGWKGSFKRYMGLKLALEELLGRPVDLVELHPATNPYFRQVATQHRQLLYAA
jgi:predicted nucleotidyltransferase